MNKNRNASPSEMRYMSIIDNNMAQQQQFKVEKLKADQDISSGNISSHSSDAESSALNSNIRKLGVIGNQGQINQFAQVQESPNKNLMHQYTRQNEEHMRYRSNEKAQTPQVNASSSKKYFIGVPMSPNEPQRTYFNRVVSNNRNPNQKEDYLIQKRGQIKSNESQQRKPHRQQKSQIRRTGEQLNEKLNEKLNLISDTFSSKISEFFSPNKRSRGESNITSNKNQVEYIQKQNTGSKSVIMNKQFNSMSNQFDRRPKPKQNQQNNRRQTPPEPDDEYLDTEALQDTVDVECNNCNQLIPFNEVNKHSLTCVITNRNIMSSINYERQIKEINNNVRKIQQAVSKRVFQLDLLLDSNQNPNSNQSVDKRDNSLKNLTPTQQKGENKRLQTQMSELGGQNSAQKGKKGHINQNLQHQNRSYVIINDPYKLNNDLIMNQDEVIEYFIDEFSNLHAVCESVLMNDDDWEKLELLIGILKEDYFDKIKITTSNQSTLKERTDQLVIFAKRLNRQIILKLKVFELYSQQQQKLIQNGQFQMESLDSLERQIMISGSYENEASIVYEQPTPRNLMNQSINQINDAFSSEDDVNFDEVQIIQQIGKAQIKMNRPEEESDMEDSIDSTEMRKNEQNQIQTLHDEQINKNIHEFRFDQKMPKSIHSNQIDIKQPHHAYKSSEKIIISQGLLMIPKEPSIISFAGKNNNNQWSGCENDFSNLDLINEENEEKDGKDKKQQMEAAAEDQNDLVALMFSLDQVEFQKIDGEEAFDPTSNITASDPLSFEPFDQIHQIRTSLLDNDKDFTEMQKSNKKELKPVKVVSYSPKKKRKNSNMMFSPDRRKLQTTQSKDMQKRQVIQYEKENSGRKKKKLQFGIPNLGSAKREQSNNRSIRNSTYDLQSSNTNNRSQLQEDAKYRLFGKNSSSSSSKHSMDSKQGDLDFEFNELNTSILENQQFVQQSNTSILSITLERKLEGLSQFNLFKLQKLFYMLKDNALAGKISKVIAQELIRKKNIKLKMKCMRTFKLNRQRQFIVRAIVGKAQERSMMDVFQGIKKYSVNQKRYRNMKIKEADGLYARRICKVCFGGLEVWKMTRKIQKAEEAAEIAYQEELEQIRLQEELQHKKQEAARIQENWRKNKNKQEFNQASNQIIETIIDEFLEIQMRQVSQDVIKEEHKLKLKHQKMEAIAIDQVVEGIIEQNSRNILIDVFYRSKIQIQNEKQELFDSVTNQVASNILENWLKQEVADTAFESLKMIKHDKLIEEQAFKGVIDDLCNYNTTKAIQLIVFELKTVERLDKQMQQEQFATLKRLQLHNQYANSIWDNLINQMITQSISQTLDNEQQNDACNQIIQQIEQQHIRSNLQLLLAETIEDEQQQIQVCEIIGNEMVDNQVIKILKEVYQDENAQQEAYIQFCNQLQDEVMVQLLDEIIDEEQNNFNMNRTYMKKATTLVNKDFINNFVKNEIQIIVKNQYVEENAIMQIVNIEIETIVKEQINRLGEFCLKEEKSIQLVRDNLINQIVEESIVSTAASIFMEAKQIKIDENEIIEQISKNLIEKQCKQIIKDVVNDQQIQNNAQIQIVDSILQQQVKLYLREMISQEVQLKTIQNDIAKDSYFQIINKLTQEVVKDTHEQLRIEEQAQLEFEIQALGNEIREHEHESYDKILNISFSEQNKEEFIKNIIEEVEEDKEDELIAPEEIEKSNQRRRKNLFGVKKLKNALGETIEGLNISGLSDVYEVWSKNERKSFLPMNKRADPLADYSSLSKSPKRDPIDDDQDLPKKSKRITINHVSQAAAARYSQLSKEEIHQRSQSYGKSPDRQNDRSISPSYTQIQAQQPHPQIGIKSDQYDNQFDNIQRSPEIKNELSIVYQTPNEDNESQQSDTVSQKKTFKQFLSDKKSPKRDDNVLNMNNLTFQNQKIVQSKQVESQDPNGEVSRFTVDSQEKNSASMRPSQFEQNKQKIVEMQTKTMSNLENYLKKHNIIQKPQTKKESGEESKSPEKSVSPRPGPKKNLFGKKNK